MPLAVPFWASRPMTAIIIWLLPEPGSPTMARVSPALTSREAPLTASITPSAVRKPTLRSRTCKIGAGRGIGSAVFRIERVTQSVTDEVQGEQRGAEKEGRKDQKPIGRADVLRSLRD